METLAARMSKLRRLARAGPPSYLAVLNSAPKHTRQEGQRLLLPR